ncbi:MAG: CDP-alcohol phosphatidyltransferase family protein [Spirochaetota bacterium]
MIPNVALIRSEKAGYNYSERICGLYPLERNIILLIKAGVKKIFLDLSKEERSFYQANVSRYVEKFQDTKIAFSSKAGIGSQYFLIPSNIFSQAHYYNESSGYFKQKGKVFTPVMGDDQFLLSENSQYKKAANLLKTYIIKNTGGFIAQKINKRISMPISMELVKTRIHPNYLTILNMIIGLLSSFFLLFNSYWLTVLGGFLFQTASVMDGVDGEVAKLTLKVSKIGSWLDTISDNSTLILFIVVLSYLYYINSSGFLPVILIIMVLAGIAVMIAMMFRYLKRYSKSGSLVAYDREFLQKLPQNDPFVFITQKLKYITKKEFFSIAFFAICLTGRAYFFIPVIAVVISVAAVILAVIDLKYLKSFGNKAS